MAATNTTVLEVEDALLALLQAALPTVPVTYAWPGPSTEPAAVFLGQHPSVADLLLDATSQDPTIKAGRRQSQEEYVLKVTIWTFRPDLSSDDARAASAQANGIYDTVYDVFADNVRLGLTTVQRASVEGWTRMLFPFNTGWGCVWTVNVNVQARLT